MGRQLTARFDSQAGADGATNAYNGFGDLTSSTTSMAGFSKTLTHLYDEAGRRTRLTHADGQAFTYAYDALDRLSGVYEGAGPRPRLPHSATTIAGSPRRAPSGWGAARPTPMTR